MILLMNYKINIILIKVFPREIEVKPNINSVGTQYQFVTNISLFFSDKKYNLYLSKKLLKTV